MSLRATLKGALGERSSETIGSSARESSGELSLNSSDAGTETFDRDVALSMVANEQEALNEIEEAIDRIFDGSFEYARKHKNQLRKSSQGGTIHSIFIRRSGSIRKEKDSRGW